jgi:hypothetical protein
MRLPLAAGVDNRLAERVIVETTWTFRALPERSLPVAHLRCFSAPLEGLSGTER